MEDPLDSFARLRIRMHAFHSIQYISFKQILLSLPSPDIKLSYKRETPKILAEEISVRKDQRTINLDRIHFPPDRYLSPFPT